MLQQGWWRGLSLPHTLRTALHSHVIAFANTEAPSQFSTCHRDSLTMNLENKPPYSSSLFLKREILFALFHFFLFVLTLLSELPARRRWDSTPALTAEAQKDSMSADKHFHESRAYFSPSSAPCRSSTRSSSLGILTHGSFKPSVATEESACWKHFFS